MNHKLCQFCHKKMTSSYPEDDDMPPTIWHFCPHCDVSFQYIYGNIKSFITRFYADHNGKTYVLDLDFKYQRTQILIMPGKLEDTVIEVLTLPYIIDGISPQNAEDKLKTIITFS